MPSVTSRSRSAVTSTSSTTHCMKNGLNSTKNSSTSAIATICASERLSPVTRPSSWRMRDAALIVAPLEVRLRGQLHRGAGEVARQARPLHPAGALRRIVNQHAVAAHLHQHHEVIEVPVQDRRQRQLLELVRLGTHGPRLQLQRARHGGQIDHRGALERQVEALAQASADRCAAHATPPPWPGTPTRIRRLRSAGSPAWPARRSRFARIALLSWPADDQSRPAMPSTGANSHSTRRRRSSITSASSCMPAARGCSRP